MKNEHADCVDPVAEANLDKMSESQESDKAHFEGPVSQNGFVTPPTKYSDQGPNQQIGDTKNDPEQGALRKTKRRRHITNTTDESGQEEPSLSAGRHSRRRRRRIGPLQSEASNDETSESEDSDNKDTGKVEPDRYLRESTDPSSLENKKKDNVTENGGRDEDEPAKIHLNLDLEAEVDLKAKILGDVTLGLTE